MNSELRNILNECSSELDDIEQRIDQLKVFDKESKYLTCYALIKACGTAEFVYRSIIADYFAKFQDDKIDQYIDNTVRKGSMSATYDNMLKLLQKRRTNMIDLELIFHITDCGENQVNIERKIKNNRK